MSFFDPALIFKDELSPRKPQQERSFQKQQAIFVAAAELFAEQGYNRTNTKEIAVRAGVSIGTLYFNFTDKRQILLTMLAEQMSRYTDIGPVDQEDLLHCPVCYLQSQLLLAFPFNVLFYNISGPVRELSAQDPQFRQKLGLLGKAIHNRMRTIVEIGLAAEMTHPGLDIESTTTTLSALIFNLYAILPNPALVSEEVYLQHHLAACQLIMRAVFKEEFIHDPN